MTRTGNSGSTHEGPRTEMLKKLRARLGGAALPYLVIFPGDKPEEPIRLADLLSIDTVVEALEKCPAPPAVQSKPVVTKQP